MKQPKKKKKVEWKYSKERGRWYQDFGTAKRYAPKGWSPPKQRRNVEAHKLGRSALRRRNLAIDWMFEHYEEYATPQELAQDASTQFDFPVAGLIPAARQLFGLKKNPHGAKPKKNLFGFGRGATLESVKARQQAEAHSLFERGEYRHAKRVKKMSPKRFAYQHGIKIEGAGQRVKRRVHKKVQRAATRGISRLFGMKRNPLPALLSALGEGAGLAAGEEAFGRIAKRRPVKKKKKKSKKPKQSKAHKTRSSKKGSKGKKRNPARRITHAVAVGNRIVAAGSRSAVHEAAQLLRAAGMRPRIGKRR